VLDEVTGVQKVNTETGAIIFESHKVSDPQRICQQLRPG
jgi:ABC-type Na+ transport system ATPase subunit NatA